MGQGLHFHILPFRDQFQWDHGSIGIHGKGTIEHLIIEPEDRK